MARKASFKARPMIPWTSWLLLLPVLTILPWLLNTFHYSLPAPADPYTADGRPQPSEHLIYGHIKALEDIGYRTVGTEEAALGEAYVEAEVRKLEQQCRSAGVVKCEVWVQRGDGKHSFDIMGHSILKLYKGIVNVILRISPLESDFTHVKKDALLLNSHIDSTLPSPGAADDGMGVGVMLEIARVLVERKESISSPIIFLWNSAEETLQDASHLFSTQHETAKTVKTVVNLEAAGTTGGALVFQATSKEVIDAYALAPRPHGTVVAADIFASGIILSDTDFVQFQKYLNVTGLDMATVGHSYFYHTRKDRLEFIERGAGQHFAINVLAVCDYLLAAGSPLTTASEFSPPDVVYFSLYDRAFVKYTMETANKIYVALSAVLLVLVATRFDLARWRALIVAFIGAPAGLISGMVGANIVAAMMSLVLGRGQSWFSHEDLCLLLFVPPAFTVHFAVQEWLSSFLSIVDQAALEHAHFFAQPMWFAAVMLLLQALKIRSAYLFACTTGIAITVILINEGTQLSQGRRGRVGFKAGYVLGFAGFIFFAVEAVTNCLDIFVPLTGRMGTDAPTEFIVATISSFLGLQLFPPATSLLYRTSSRAQRRQIITGVAAISALAIAFFANPAWSPYDAMHPRRVGVQYTYNVTTTDTTCHVAFMDRGPGAHRIATAIQQRYGAADDTLEANPFEQRASDWDSLYPLSPFLEAHKFPLAKTSPWVAADVNFQWPEITVDVQEGSSAAGTRKLELKFSHTDLLWPVLAFDAEIVDWSYDFAPPKGKRIHHIKSATSPHDQTLELALTVKVSSPDEKISMHWTGIDTNQMYPGTALRKGLGQPASKYFVDMNAWLEDEYKGAMDVLMIGVVAGVLQI